MRSSNLQLNWIEFDTLKAIKKNLETVLKQKQILLTNTMILLLSFRYTIIKRKQFNWLFVGALITLYPDNEQFKNKKNKTIIKIKQWKHLSNVISFLSQNLLWWFTPFSVHTSIAFMYFIPLNNILHIFDFYLYICHFSIDVFVCLCIFFLYQQKNCIEKRCKYRMNDGSFLLVRLFLILMSFKFKENFNQISREQFYLECIISHFCNYTISGEKFKIVE